MRLSLSNLLILGAFLVGLQVILNHKRISEKIFAGNENNLLGGGQFNVAFILPVDWPLNSPIPLGNRDGNLSPANKSVAVGSEKNESDSLEDNMKNGLSTSISVDESFIIPPAVPKSPIQPRIPVNNTVPILCKACQKAIINKDLKCPQRIEKLLRDGQELQTILATVVKEHPSCSACHPRVCKSRLDRQVGFDVAAPKQLWGTTPTLRSLPKEYRIPQQVIQSANLSAAYFHNWPEDKYILYTYNPSLVPAPASLVANISNARYVAVFRLSPLQTCSPEFYPHWKHKSVNFYGFAILDGSLQIIRDVIVDLNNYMEKKRNSFEDARLAILKGEMYLTHSHNLLSIEVTTIPTDQSIPNMFASHPGLHIRKKKPLGRIAGAKTDYKNAHIFEDSSQKLNLELWPEDPHEVRSMTVSKKRGHANMAWTSTISKDLPPPSFASHDRLLNINPYKMSRARGSACCLKVDPKEYKDLIPINHVAHKADFLLVGVSHSKSSAFKTDHRVDQRLYMYLSRLYAFLPVSPFPIVARSGFFCLSDVEEPSQDPHILFKKELSNSLIIKFHQYKCPRVHFISGMTESVTNASEVIVAYGINDCVPRFVVLEKRSMMQRLFTSVVSVDNDTPLENSSAQSEPKSSSLHVSADNTSHLTSQAPVLNSSTVSIHERDTSFITPLSVPKNPLKPRAWMNKTVPILCKDCQKAIINKDLKCPQRIDKLLLDGQELQTTLAAVAKEYPSCSACDPNTCESRLDRQVGFDVAAPKQLWGTTPTLLSLPKEYRIPSRVIQSSNLSAAYFQDWPEDKYILYTYNPSLVPAPASLVANISNAKYVAVFRLSPLTSCSPEFYPHWKHKTVNFYGFAVLDGGLQIIRDVIVDLNDYVNKAKASFEDARLVLLNGGMYLAHTRCLLSIEITTWPDKGSIPNMFASHSELHIRTKKPLALVMGVTKSFKNGNYFEDAFMKPHLEFWPEEPHDVRPIKISRKGSGRVTAGEPIESNELPSPSFASHDRLLVKNPYTMSHARGSACCLKIDRKEYQDLIPVNHTAQKADFLLVGVSHSKSSFFNTETRGDQKLYLYLSRLYAFLPVSPFPIVARSGYFCLSDVEEPSQDPHILFQGDLSNSLIVKNHQYKCPRVHFISGMTESVTNASEVIVAYGINDCVPRFVVLEKRSMMQRLFKSFLQ